MLGYVAAVTLLMVALYFYSERRRELAQQDSPTSLYSRVSTSAVGVPSSEDLSEQIQELKNQRRANGVSRNSSVILDSPSQAVQDRKMELEASATLDMRPVAEETSPWDAAEKSAARLARKQRHQEREAERLTRRERKSARSHRHRHSEQKKADFLNNHKPDDATAEVPDDTVTIGASVTTPSVRPSHRRDASDTDAPTPQTSRRTKSKSSRHRHRHNDTTSKKSLTDDLPKSLEEQPQISSPNN